MSDHFFIFLIVFGLVLMLSDVFRRFIVPNSKGEFPILIVLSIMILITVALGIK